MAMRVCRIGSIGFRRSRIVFGLWRILLLLVWDRFLISSKSGNRVISRIMVCMRSLVFRAELYLSGVGADAQLRIF